MPVYHVHVTIENKSGISDPEGETILNDLVVRSGTSEISEIRMAKMLKFTINETDKTAAREKVQKICDDLRIYNPLVSKVTFDVLTVPPANN